MGAPATRDRGRRCTRDTVQEHKGGDRELSSLHHRQFTFCFLKCIQTKAQPLGLNRGCCEGASFRMESMEVQDEIDIIMPHLVDFLCQDIDWLIDKAQALVPEENLNQHIPITNDDKDKISAILQMLQKCHPKAWKRLIDTICMECALPMDLEVPLVSLTGEGSSELKWNSCWSNNENRQRRLHEYAERYKQQIKESLLENYRFKDVRDPGGLCNPMFVEPLIKGAKMPKDKHRNEGVREKTLVTEDIYDTVGTDNLFRRTSLVKTHVILLMGMPGTGKTMLTRRICYDWAGGKFNQIALTFLFEFRQLNLIKRHLTLRELLFDLFLMPALFSDEVFDYIIKNPMKILIIFDGLDEFLGHFTDNTPTANYDFSQRTSISQLFTNILLGTLLQGCTVIVTCRPKMVNSFPLYFVDNVAEVLGFDKKRVELYIDDFFYLNPLKDKVLSYVRDNNKLMHMCFVPALCHMICVCLEHLLNTSSAKSKLPQTMTQFYLKMLIIFIQKRKTQFTEETTIINEFRSLILRLSSVALYGLDNNTSVFYNEQISEDLHSFAVNHGLLSVFQVKKFDSCTDVGYSFVHLSSQEFFAALYLLVSETITERKLQKKFSLKSKWASKQNSTGELMDNLHIFLSGLSSKDCQTFLYNLSGQKNMILKKQDTIIESLKRLADTQLTGPKLIELCHCTYETQNENLARHFGKFTAMKYELKNFRISPVDMTSLMFVVKHGSCLVSLDFAGCPMELECLDVLGTSNDIQALSFRHQKYGDSFAEALSPVISGMVNLKKIRVTAGHLTTDGISALSQSFLLCSALQEINLQNNHLKVEDMILLTELFLKMEELRVLDLSHNDMNVMGILKLLKSAVSSPSITSIQIIGDTAKIIFSSNDIEVISSPIVKKAREESTDIKVKRLSLENCSLTSEEIPQLAEILTGPQFSCVNLSGNPFGDLGFKKLIDSLPNMHISEKLELNRTMLSEEGIAYLLYSTVTCLNIKLVSASGLDHMAEILFFNSNDDCEREIRITGFKYHQKALEKLCTALQQCNNIAHLNLSGNSLENVGILEITQIAAKLKCIRSVNLSGNRITLGGITCLAESLSVVKNLTDITISLGTHQKVLLTFQEAQRTGPSSLPSKSFSLTEYRMNSQKLKKLILALIQCSDLTEINLSNNALSYKIIETLLNYFPQLPHLTKLKLSTSDLSPSCVLLLANSINICDCITEVVVRSAEYICLHLQRPQKANVVICRFNNCKIGKNDITHLMKILQQNPNLLEVSMCSNHLAEDGILQLLSSVKNYTEISASLRPNEAIRVVFSLSGDSFRKLELSGYNFPADYLRKLCAVLERNNNVNHLKLKNNNISLEAIKDFLTVQSRKPHYFTLSIDEPWVGEEDLISLVHHFLQLPSKLHSIRVFQKKLTIEVFGTDNQEVSASAGLQALKSLRFNECTLQINNLKSLESVIRDSISLTELSLSRTNLGDTGVQIVSNFQTLLPNLKIIKLASVNMSDIGMVHLTESLTHCKSVQDIDLSSNAIGEKGRQSLIRLLMQRRNFHAVNVCDCGFSMTSEEGKMFLSQLSKSPNLQKINLQNMSLDDSSLLLLCQALPRLLSIRKLILANNKITCKGVFHLSENIYNCTMIESIDLSFNGIGDVNMAFLPNLKCLKKIKLSQCNISTVGGLNLTTTLQQCPLVEEIDLSGNNFENKTTSHLFTALSQVKHLKVLHLRSCGFGEKSESALMEALGSCVQMEDISLSENTFTEQCFLKLANQFPRLRLLKKLDLRVCGVSDNVCKSLAEDLGCCQNLEEIILSWNRIGDDGTCALSSSLKHMRRLKKLDLEKNQIRVKGAEALAHALSFCLWIKVISIICPFLT
ncbi:protein NLRC5 isoform X2 [Engystomops pustulosus]|uniref:protein NLRC5 isoform X2 n=1 Tax=Engystomops pustulosus TaxID=76066 RepID=UPI003AFAACB1